ncbi:ATP-binding protein [Nitrospirillum amazonense]|nr:winged helix-turn-helix domain-containing protein [Nitrospirillum amazonense]MDG3439491.1 winged helix-turn-helix domain-containing protein [Nitrospirillum amazonense]
MMAFASPLAVASPEDQGTSDDLHFGPFRLSRAERRLERDGKLVPLGGRALDVLFALAARCGQVVSKAELTRVVWPGVIVEEGNLRFHIVALRKALGDSAQDGRYLTTVAGRGYCFTATATPSPNAPLGATAVQVPQLPLRTRRVIGIDATVVDAGSELLARRFLTLVGPPGIGKTTLAVKLGHDLLEYFPDGVAFVELGALNGDALVPAAIAAAAGHSLPVDYRLEHLLAIFRDRRMLLILDSCEHVIDFVADLAEKLFSCLPELSILATSRESLRAEGEHVFRLFPLACPPPTLPSSSEAALCYSAVEFFIDRVQANQLGFQLSDEDTPLVGEICRKLDGIPLALELAAGRVPAYGIRQTAALLNGHFRLLWEGRRTAPLRLQTLSAALDWSYELLNEPERAVLRRISIFVGYFTLDAAIAVACLDNSDRDNSDRHSVVRILANLVSKSLVALHETPHGARYRLLDTTRVYGLSKMESPDEARAVAYNHARFCYSYPSGSELIY